LVATESRRRVDQQLSPPGWPFTVRSCRASSVIDIPYMGVWARPRP